ncbi:MAG: biotin--[acetyl-CoA-carboxylase] ligase [Deltaproteobacteria bacterium]|nr:biotin--[acetyl-CoA-carboxylase] ligase [Deltaproteobacteria bacterium]
MTLNSKNDRLKKEILLEGLGKSLFATNIILHKSLDSTNRLAKELASKGSPEGTVVLSEEQTAGTGRMERRWLSQGYMNLLASALIRPAMPSDQIFVLTMILALATINGVNELTSLKPMIKWPNDIYLGPKKLGGILTEFSVKGKDVKWVVLGLGLNVNWMPEKDTNLLYPATSILAESGKKCPRNELLALILRSLEGLYKEVQAGRLDPLYRRWNQHSLIMGKDVEIHSAGEIIMGKVLRIDRNGGLVIKDSAGREQVILSGDVSVRF